MRSLVLPVIAAAALAVLGASAGAQDARIATDGELRVAYCLGVNDWYAAQFTGPQSLTTGTPLDHQVPQMFAERHARLTDYLVARGYLTGERPTASLIGVVAAKRAGATDAQELSNAIGACGASQCAAARGPLYSKCLDTCMAQNPIQERIARCSDPHLLPY